MSRVLKPALAAGANPEPDRMFTVVNYTCYLAFPTHLAFIALFFSIGVPLLGYFNILSCLAWVAAWWLNQRGRRWAAIQTLSAEVVVHAVFATVMLGWRSGFHTPFMPLITGVMINHRLKTRAMISQAVGLVVLYGVLYAYTKDYIAPGVSPGLLDAMNYMHILIVFAALCVVSYFYREASLRSEKRMEDLATTDQLTRLANRHKMRQLLAKESSRTDRTRHAFSLVITDIDHFKKINDTFGHDFGDVVLQKVAEVLQQTARVPDTVARWGGEEFLILLPETELRGALEAGERMRAAIEQQPFDFHGESFRITMTFGAAIHNASDDVEETMKRADRALYAGKHSGRNRVVGYGAEADRGVA